ncbi:helix-turn-helix domain-containing protein [Flavobacterium sp.]|uniref:helix-turn-helix domain-containing protein n=1 Tax=Flavobacterium sp. TaxID=239 RepID=UPI003D6BE126
MKLTTTIKNTIGLTQDEMAMLLGVTRSQWSMYEIGKRSLPLEATKQLAGILQHLQNAKATSDAIQKVTTAEQKKNREWLEQEYTSLQYKKAVLDRKIAAMETKRAEGFAALEVVDYLANHPAKIVSAHFITAIKTRAVNSLNKNTLHHLQSMHLKKDQLEMLKNTLEKKMHL